MGGRGEGKRKTGGKGRANLLPSSCREFCRVPRPGGPNQRIGRKRKRNKRRLERGEGGEGKGEKKENLAPALRRNDRFARKQLLGAPRFKVNSGEWEGGKGKEGKGRNDPITPNASLLSAYTDIYFKVSSIAQTRPAYRSDKEEKKKRGRGKRSFGPLRLGISSSRRRRKAPHQEKRDGKERKRKGGEQIRLLRDDSRRRFAFSTSQDGARSVGGRGKKKKEKKTFS